MVNINTFEDAKQAVAEKHGWKNWMAISAYYGMRANTIGWITRFADEYAELEGEAVNMYAESRSRKAANEAVKADRKLIEESNPTWCTHNTSFIDDNLLNKLPLPFPEESRKTTIKPLSELWKDAGTITELFKEFFGLEFATSLQLEPKEDRIIVWDQVGAGCQMVLYYDGEYLIERESTNADVSPFKYVDTLRKYGYSV